MPSRWSDADARGLVRSFEAVGEPLALRVYSSRLIGSEPSLVLHGGGNTSLKSRARDLFQNEVEVLHVKGSGWDLASIEPEGLPALRLAQLRRLRDLDDLDDETMMGELRRSLLEPARAPNPSVETLLHAFLPHRYIDHSHADAILALTNQPDGAARVRALFGTRVAFVPYVMAGFRLAKLAAEIFEKQPDVEALVLEKHGLFTFGDEARQSYERHVAITDRAEQAIRDAIGERRLLGSRPLVAVRDAGDVAHLVRGALAEPAADPGSPPRRWILEHRSSEEISHFAASQLGPALAAASPITPDHVIRTKGPYLLVNEPPYSEPAALAARLRDEVERYREAYRAYFARNAARRQTPPKPLDPTPRVVILPGVGLFAVGSTRRDARIAADIAEHTIRTKLWASMIGHYEGISEADLFDMEYWVLEQAKLGARSAPVLDGLVALVTGGAGAIGEGIARALLRAGAHLVLVDQDGERLDAVAGRLRSQACEVVEADVTDERDVQLAFRQAAEQFGGVDLVVANAGIACAGALQALEADDFRRTLEVNATGTFLTVREGLRHLEAQGTGGNVVILSSKNVFAPGREFGAYSASKAAAHQLGRVAALEGAAFGVRVNMVNADAVFGEPENRSGLWKAVGPQRAAARGIPPAELEEFYRKRNLLGVRVTADQVGEAVVFFASQRTPTTGAALPVDGGLPEAFPR